MSLKLSSEYFQCFSFIATKLMQFACELNRASSSLFSRAAWQEDQKEFCVCVIIAAEAEGFLFSFLVGPVGQIRWLSPGLFIQIKGISVA